MFGTTLSRQHMAAFILLIALPVSLAIVLISFMFRSEAIRIAREQTTEAVKRSADALNTEALNLSLFAAALANDSPLRNNAQLYAGASSGDARYAASRNIDASISWFFRMTSRTGSVHIFFPEGEPFVLTNYQISGMDLDLALQRCMDPSRDRGVVWCLDDLILYPDAIEKSPVLSMVIRPNPRPNEKESIKAILVSFHIPFLDSLAARAARAKQDGDTSLSFVVNQNGKIILSDKSEEIGKDFGAIKERFQKNYLLIARPVESLGWTYAEAIPLREFTRNMDLITRWVFAAFILIGVLFGLYTISFFGDIVKPLHTIIARMGRVSEGDFSVRVGETGPEEFKKLGMAFNRMVSRIDELTTQIVAEQKERTKVEIEALRFQLNPHFICNTLNSIGMMATIAKADSIKKMTNALTRIMRETLSADDTLFSFEDEIKNLESYVYIMKIRFGDSFTFNTEIGKDLAQAGIPTMLLQPLVENAILHGLRGRRGGGSIVVAAERQDSLVRIEVRDDGYGMNPEKLQELFSGPQEGGRGFNRIGLYNVRRRILLSYPSPCNLSIASFPNEGTVVSLLIPYLAAPEARKTEERQR